MLKVLKIVLFCSLLPLSRGVVPGVFSVVSPEGIHKVVSGVLLQDGLLQKHLQAIQIPGIVSRGGLLGSFISITGLEAVNVQLPTVSVTLLPGIGGQLTIATKLEINGNLLLSGLIHISVDVNLNAKVRVTDYSAGVFQVVIEDCQSLLGPFGIRLLSGFMSAAFPTTLVSSTALGVGESSNHLLVPLGAVGKIQYQLASLPLITDLYVGLDLNTVIHQLEGGNISRPVSAVPVTLQGNVLNLGLSQAFLNAALSLLGRIQPQTFISTLDVDKCSEFSVLGGTRPAHWRSTVSPH
ncbi:BPI fold-containing family B member 4-like [Mauremys mutica]|uniref:BPI fold-containing family B member 4-like n=1 Tax=Mauremys mutica TaxID=74926 RepID=UPI001D16BC18|nr:BPI fold-containing family B member 4-like [Mauremys mutica]